MISRTAGYILTGVGLGLILAATFDLHWLAIGWGCLLAACLLTPLEPTRWPWRKQR